MLGHALDAVPMTRHAADEGLGEHFVHFCGVERPLILSGGFEGM